MEYNLHCKKLDKSFILQKYRKVFIAFHIQFYYKLNGKKLCYTMAMIDDYLINQKLIFFKFPQMKSQI